jgi:hypothetical protein
MAFKILCSILRLASTTLLTKTGKYLKFFISGTAPENIPNSKRALGGGKGFAFN